MVDQLRILSLGAILYAVLLFTFSVAEPCDINADVCEYTFRITHELTMTKGRQLVKTKNGKLYPVEDGNNTSTDPIPERDVISMDGYKEPRMVIAVNGQIPGPAIEAYIGQTVVVNVENQLHSSDVTLHWHGLYQKGSPFMDGVPHVTQCPIGPSQSFQYKFNLTQTGTYWYHSHIGAQRTMGLYGAFIIRERAQQHSTTSLDEHTMVISDYNHDWDSNMAYLKAEHGMYKDQKKIYVTSSSDGSHFPPFHFQSGLVNGRGRFYYKAGVHNEAPLAKFSVETGKQYRFRVIGAGTVYPFTVSIDGHKLQIVASDGCEIEPRFVDAVVINPGERFDFIITADQPIANYWIRGNTKEIEKNDTFEAILHYNDALDEEPYSSPKKCSENDVCSVLNCAFSYYPVKEHRKCILLSEMNSDFDYEVPRIVPGKWKEHFLNFAFPGEPGHTPASVNGRRYVQPSVNPLYQPNEVSTLCDEQDCGVDRLCDCTHSSHLNKGDTIQLVFLNMGKGKGFHHPIHMHGHSFSVVKMGYPLFNKTSGETLRDNPDIDCRGDPSKNYCNDATWRNNNWGGDNIPGLKLERAPLKDTIIVPSGGYAIVRIKADNPGLWFMHCHIEIHNLGGMALMLNESFADVTKPPEHFPVCRSFTPEANKRIPTANTTIPTPLMPACEGNSSKGIMKMTVSVLVAVIYSLTFVIIGLIIILVKRNHRKDNFTDETNPDFSKEEYKKRPLEPATAKQLPLLVPNKGPLYYHRPVNSPPAYTDIGVTDWSSNGYTC